MSGCAPTSRAFTTPPVAVDRLVYELSFLVNQLVIPNTEWRRVRFAVTQQEYDALRDVCLRQDGYFFGSIRGVPLLVEDDPARPVLLREVTNKWAR